MSSMSKLFKTIADAASSRSGQGSAGRSGGGRDWRAIAHTVAQKVQEKTAPTDQAAGGARASQTARPGTSAGQARQPAAPAAQGPRGAGSEDEAAIARYEYLTRTAPPEKLEQVNRDAFERLSPQQRDEVRSRFDAEFPAAERPASSRPEDLARSATRAEVMKPGLIQRVLGGGGSAGGASGGRGRGLGAAAAGVGIGAVGGGLLAAVAGGALLSSAAGPLLEGIEGIEAPEGIADLGQMAEGVDAEGLLGGTDLGQQLGDLGSQWGFGGNPFE